MGAFLYSGKRGMDSGEMSTKPIPVVCKLCGTRMYARREDVGRAMRCPDCDTLTEIRPPARTKPRAKPRDPGQYRIGKADWLREDKSPADGEPLIAVKCPRCFSRLHPRRSQAGKRVRCPDCDTRFIVPEWKPKVPRTIEPRDLGGYDVGVRQARPAVAVLPGHEEERVGTVPAAEPPRWTFLSGVFSFPFSPSARGRCMALSAGALVIGGMFFLAMSLNRQSSAGVIAAGAISMALVFPLVWTLSFAAACMFAIIEDTSSGADVIEVWPESDWRLWIFPMLTIGFHMLAAATLAYVAYRLAPEWSGAAALAWLSIGFVVFPLTLLSALEDGMPVAVVSVPVWSSLVRQPLAWIAFYAVTAVMLVAAGLPLLLLGALYVRLPDALQAAAPFLALVYLAPTGAVAWFIYARLMGRLAWKITSESAAEGDDDANAEDAEDGPSGTKWRHPAIRTPKVGNDS